jgi:hypothetical protein
MDRTACRGPGRQLAGDIAGRGLGTGARQIATGNSAPSPSVVSGEGQVRNHQVAGAFARAGGRCYSGIAGHSRRHYPASRTGFAISDTSVPARLPLPGLNTLGEGCSRRCSGAPVCVPERRSSARPCRHDDRRIRVPDGRVGDVNPGKAEGRPWPRRKRRRRGGCLSHCS